MSVSARVRRPRLVLLAAAAAIAALVGPLSAAPASAATLDFELTGAPSLDGVSGVIGVESGLVLGPETDQLTVTLPPEAALLSPTGLEWEIWGWALSPAVEGFHSSPGTPLEIELPPGFYDNDPWIDSSTNQEFYYLVLSSKAANSFGLSRVVFFANFFREGTGPLEIEVNFVDGAFNDFAQPVTPASATPNWGDVVTVTATPGFWTDDFSVASEAQLDSPRSRRFSDDTVNLDTQVSADGSTLTIALPATRPDVSARFDTWGTGTRLTLSYYRADSGGLEEYFLQIALKFDDTDRLYGPDRFATSSRVADEFGFDTFYREPPAPVVYLANGRNFPDALSAAPAAGFAGGPLLLTERDVLPDAIGETLFYMQPEKIVIVGGVDAVSDAVKTSVETDFPDAEVVRVAGASRFETSQAISRDAFGPAVASGRAFLATGANFPDALSASAAAGAFGEPVILVNSALPEIDAATLELLSDLNVTEVIIVGGPAVISSTIEESLVVALGAGNVQRVAGADRYATSVAINGLFAGSLPPVESAYLAVGTGFADALSGAALAGANGSPLYVVPGTCVPQPVLTSINDLGVSDSVVLFGGPNALNAGVANLQACTN